MEGFAHGGLLFVSVLLIELYDPKKIRRLWDDRELLSCTTWRNDRGGATDLAVGDHFT